MSLESMMDDALIQRFADDCSLRGLSKSTCNTYISKTKAFAVYIRATGIKLLDVDKNSIRAYLYHLRNDRLLKHKSIETIYCAISAFYEFLEEEGLRSSNPVKSVRKRYLHTYKKGDDFSSRRIISIEEASNLVNSILDTRNKAIILLLFKTGIRINELTSLDVDDVNLEEQSIKLKMTPKRSNRLVYFDNETADVLARWLRSRKTWNSESPALFLSNERRRIDSSTIQKMVKKCAARVELHDTNSDRMEDHFSPHCCRHWFTTHLRRAGMPREFIQELRGDVRKEAIDIYDHIDHKELKESYLAHIPQLGI